MMPRRNHARHPRRKRGSYTTFLFPPISIDDMLLEPEKYKKPEEE